VNLNSGCSAVIGQPGAGVVLPQVAGGEVHLCVCDRAKRIVNRRELMQSLLLPRQLLAEILAVDCLWGVLVPRARERAAELLPTLLYDCRQFFLDQPTAASFLLFRLLTQMIVSSSVISAPLLTISGPIFFAEHFEAPKSPSWVVTWF